MFGSSPGAAQKEKEIEPVPGSPTADTDQSGPGAISLKTEDLSPAPQKRNSLNSSRKAADDTSSPTTEKKRRSSSVAKASALFSSAKNHLTGLQSDKSPPLTPMQKLGKTDPALSVPQGSNNNSAGESVPTPRSSFRVGVTEDKNKKCRRTMEDTHAYLYNFLGTPAPQFSSEGGKKLSEDKETTNNESNSDVSTHVVETDNGYFAIFDGHAGTFAADWCGKKLHVILEDLMRKNPNTPVPELLDQTFTSADQQLEKLPLKNSGCTAITAVLRWEDRVPNSQSATGSTAIAPAAAAAAAKDSEPENAETPTQDTPTANATTADASSKSVPKLQETATRARVLYTANVGDARIVLCRNGKALRLSYDHKGSDENEGKRIANAGGLILNNRVNGVLAVTRALGDSYLKDLVTGHPYTTETVIQPDIDEFLILACDGLWDVCSDQEAVDLIRNTTSPQVASKQLVDHALARFSTDNLSVMVIRFDSKTQAANTAIGVEGDPASRKKGGVSEVEMLIGEAKRKSGLGLADGTAASSTDSAVSDEVKRDQETIEEELSDQEPGPELTPEGLGEVEKIKGEKENEGPKGETEDEVKS